MIKTCDIYRNISFAGNATYEEDTPPNVVRELVYARICFALDATVANRYSQIYIYRGADIVCELPTTAAMVASSTNYVNFGRCYALSINTTNGVHHGFLMPCIIPPDCSIRFGCSGGVAGDTITIKLLFRDAIITSKDDKTGNRRQT